MTIQDLIKIYETKKKKYGIQAYRHISNVLKEAKELHKKIFPKVKRIKRKLVRVESLTTSNLGELLRGKTWKK